MTPEQLGVLGFLMSAGALVGIWAHLIVSHLDDQSKTKTVVRTSADHDCSGEGEADCPNPFAHWSMDELVLGRRAR